MNRKLSRLHGSILKTAKKKKLSYFFVLKKSYKKYRRLTGNNDCSKKLREFHFDAEHPHTVMANLV